MIRAMFGSRSPSVPPRRSALARRGSRLPAALAILLAAAVSAQTPATLPETMTLDNVKSFLAANDVGTVEAFIAALPPLHKRHFVAVHGSAGPEKNFISGTHPRIVSWGADSRFIASWTTHPQSPTRDHVEFLQAVPSAGKWLAGVIDFSADPVEITQPASCAGCHTSMNRPLWGANISTGDPDLKFHGVAGDGSSGSDLANNTMRASADPRITALEFKWKRRSGKPYRELDGVGDTWPFPLWEFARTIAMRHGEVVYGNLMLRPDADWVRARIICSVDGPRPGHFSQSAALWDPRLFANGKTAVQGWNSGNMIVWDRYYRGGGGRLTDAVWFLALHDAYQRSPAVRAEYKKVMNVDSIRWDNVRWSLGLHYPSRKATAAEEFLANYKEFFGTSGQAYLDHRRRRIHGPGVAAGDVVRVQYSETVLQQHAESFARVVCAALRSPAPSALSATAGVVDGWPNVTLTWTDNSSDETGFPVRLRVSGASAWIDAPSAAADATTTTLPRLAFGETYEFQVGAKNHYGRAWSGTASATTPAGPPPSGPQRLTVARTAALDGSHGVRLTWTAPSSTATGLDVEARETAADASWKVVKQVGADVRSSLLTGIDASKRHAFRVVAVDANRKRGAGVETLPPPVPDVAGGSVSEDEAWTSSPSLPGGGSAGLTWSLSDGDAAAFRIDAADGAVTMSAKDHEDPKDGDKDNLYEVAVTVADGSGNAAARWIRVWVTNVNEAPAFEESAALEIEIPEGTTGALGSPVVAVDPDGDALTYSLSGADATSFAIDSSTSQLAVGEDTDLNFEARTSYAFNVAAADAGGLSASRSVKVTVTDLDEAITITGLANGRTPEGRPYASPAPGAAGARGPLVWTLGGPDAARFTVARATGAISMTARDHEAPEDADGNNVYEATLRVTDADGARGAAPFSVTVTNVNEAPFFDPAAELSLEIREGATGPVGPPFAASDPDGDALTYSLAGADAASFAIGPASGQLSVTTGLGAGGRTSYGVEVVATDAGSPPLSARRAARVAVTPDSGGGEDPEATGSGAPGGGGGAPATPTPPEPDPPAPPGTDPLAPSATPLTARFLPDCSEEGACRAAVGENVLFEDMSEGRATRRRWDFGDGANSARRVVSHAWSDPGFFTVTLEMTNGRDVSSESRTFLVESASPRGTCEPDAFTRCLGHSRFAVQVDWWTVDQSGTGGQSGRARVVEVGGDESSLFSFFGDGNWELLVKVLDGCAVNGSFWVFGAAATDLGYRIAVTDTRASRVMEYENRPGSEARAVSDTNAFRGACERN